jgi:hypothetical protein
MQQSFQTKITDQAVEKGEKLVEREFAGPLLRVMAIPHS